MPFNAFPLHKGYMMTFNTVYFFFCLCHILSISIILYSNMKVTKLFSPSLFYCCRAFHVDKNKQILKKDVSVLFLIIRNMCEELLCDLVIAQLVIHRDHQPLGLGVHVTHLHSSLVVEKHMVALTCGINAHIKLILLSGPVDGKYKDTKKTISTDLVCKQQSVHSHLLTKG